MMRFQVLLAVFLGHEFIVIYLIFYGYVSTVPAIPRVGRK